MHTHIRHEERAQLGTPQQPNVSRLRWYIEGLSVLCQVHRVTDAGCFSWPTGCMLWRQLQA
jgi:hypothetical protein